MEYRYKPSGVCSREMIFDIENNIVESEQNLAQLIDQLTGDEFAIAGLSNLFKK